MLIWNLNRNNTPIEYKASRDTIDTYVGAFTRDLELDRFDFLWGTCQIVFDSRDGLDYRDRIQMTEAAKSRHQSMMRAFQIVVDRTRSTLEKSHPGFEWRTVVFIHDKAGSAPHLHWVSALPIGAIGEAISLNHPIDTMKGAARLYEFHLQDIRAEAERRRASGERIPNLGRLIGTRDVLIEKLEYGARGIGDAVMMGLPHDHLARFYPRNLSPMKAADVRQRGRAIAVNAPPMKRSEPGVRPINIQGLKVRQLTALIANHDKNGLADAPAATAARERLKELRRTARAKPAKQPS